mgnify:CR=1 FL=1
MYWDQLTSPQLDQISRNTPVILPIAATEQHGPHLPLATDRMIGEHFCHVINEKMNEKVLIMPCIGITCSEHHMDFAGSLTLRHETFLLQVEDILHSVIAHGFKNLIILNSHGGNQGIGQVILEKTGWRNPKVNFAFATWWKIALEEIRSISTGPFGSTGHAGEFETSLMLLIAPELVHKDQFKHGENQQTFDWAENDMLQGASASFYQTMKQRTSNGVFGDPTLASVEKGKRITAAVSKKLIELIDSLNK